MSLNTGTSVEKNLTLKLDERSFMNYLDYATTEPYKIEV